jgi:F-type H+-transporting ATPase subunit a
MPTPLILAESGFRTPGAGDFELPPLIDGVPWLTKPVLLALLAIVLIVGFFTMAMRKRALVPDKLQFVAEGAYNFVRNTIARDSIGAAEYKKYLPYLVALFFFVLVNNLFGLFPLTLFPTMSRVAFPMALAVIAWVVFNAVGIKRQGFIGYFKNMMFPSGVPAYVYPLLAPLEFMSTVLVRPVTLSLRLFANMFAGHLLMLVFVTGGEYLIHQSGPIKIVGPVSWIFVIALSFLELLIQVLQAYIITVLTALYIAGALASEH